MSDDGAMVIRTAILPSVADPFRGILRGVISYFPQLTHTVKGECCMRVFTPIILAIAVFIAAPAFAQSAADSNMEILMEKVKADKKLLVSSNMSLTDAEAKAFWPLYDEYQKELGKLNQTLGNTIKEYADAFNKGPVENDTAKKLLNEALTVQESEVKLRRTYADKVSKALSWSKTARYIQIETKVRSIVNVELARAIPLTY